MKKKSEKKERGGGLITCSVRLISCSNLSRVTTDSKESSAENNFYEERKKESKKRFKSMNKVKDTKIQRSKPGDESSSRVEKYSPYFQKTVSTLRLFYQHNYVPGCCV